jgi:hypothetical protein
MSETPYGSAALHLLLCKGIACTSTYIHGNSLCFHLKTNLGDKLSDPLVKDS